jgi:hypothetical protein
MHRVDGKVLVRGFSDFFMVSSFFYSNHCSGSMLSKNWRVCTIMAVSNDNEVTSTIR